MTTILRKEKSAIDEYKKAIEHKKCKLSDSGKKSHNIEDQTQKKKVNIAIETLNGLKAFMVMLAVGDDNNQVLLDGFQAKIGNSKSLADKYSLVYSTMGTNIYVVVNTFPATYEFLQLSRRRRSYNSLES